MQQGTQLTVVGKIYFYYTPLWKQKKSMQSLKNRKKKKTKKFTIAKVKNHELNYDEYLTNKIEVFSLDISLQHFLKLNSGNPCWCVYIE